MKAKTDRPSPRQAAQERFMQIGEVAERTHLTQRTLRYYESIGLLEPSGRMEGGFRLYSAADVRRLERITELKRLLGVPLSVIREIVNAEDLLQQLRQERRTTPDLHTKRASLERAMAVIEAQLTIVRERIEAMQQLQARYERRLTRTRERLKHLDSHLAQRPQTTARPS